MANIKNLEKKGFKYVCGVDEAGRGPLAGPMSLSFFVVPIKDYKKVLNPLLKLGLNDSKKVLEKNREELFQKMEDFRHSREDGNPSLLDYFTKHGSSVCTEDDGWRKKHGSRIKSGMTGGGANYFNSMISAKQIDKNGVAKCYQILIKKMLKKIPKKTYFLLDGAIKFPKEISHEVIIGGDGIEPTIMAASIISKVMRDRKMIQLAKKYPEYGFEIHKGYGTLKHRKAIKKYGLSDEHRKSFCKKIKTKL